jgi:hypothetical protein
MNLPDKSYGTIGPLTILKVKGKELIPGDIINIGEELAVVLRSYSLEHINRQNLVVDTGNIEVSPLHTAVEMGEEMIIFRAVEE